MYIRKIFVNNSNYLSMSLKKIVVLLIVILSVNSLSAQYESKPFYKLSYFTDSLMVNRDYGGDVTIVQDAKLEKLMTNFSIAYRNQNQKIWRVQIYFGNGRAGRIQAQGIKANFEARHPGIVAVLVFDEPYFKVRVGEFANRLDAERLKAQIFEEYEKLFIIETYERD